MVTVKKEGVLLKKTDLEFENEGVLNPAVIREGDVIHLIYRAVRKGNYSTLGHCLLNSPLVVAERDAVPLLPAQFDYESHGMEDPRITQIEGTYYLTYIAYNGKDALGALATSVDLKDWHKQGIIVPKINYNDFNNLIADNKKVDENYTTNNYSADNGVVMDKDLVFFPRRIHDNLVFLHRIKPGIQLVSVKEIEDLTPEYWELYFNSFDEHIALAPKYKHEVRYLGGGCPPIETEHGWLVIYHGVQDAPVKGYEYSACVALLDLEDPRKEIARLPYPLFKPGEDFELTGDVDDVVFPTGTALFEDTLYIYYGAADDIIAVASVSLSELLNELLTFV